MNEAEDLEQTTEPLQHTVRVMLTGQAQDPQYQIQTKIHHDNLAPFEYFCDRMYILSWQ